LGPDEKGLGRGKRNERSLQHLIHLSQLAEPHSLHQYRIIVIWAEKVIPFRDKFILEQATKAQRGVEV
jgi:hypothetical protein